MILPGISLPDGATASSGSLSDNALCGVQCGQGTFSPAYIEKLFDVLPNTKISTLR